MSRTGCALAVFLVAGCGSSGSPASPAPAPAPVPPAPLQWTVTGALISTAGVPVGGATVQQGAVTVHTDGSGVFSFTHQSSVPLSLLITHPGTVERRVWIRGGQTRTDLALDPIALVSPFDLTFYRQLIRDGFQGTGNEPLRRWTVEPRFYVRTTEDSGAEIDSDTLSRVFQGLTAGVQHYSPYGPPHIEHGPEDRPETEGWIIVRLHRRWQAGDPCGLATIGGNYGWISLYMDVCRCPGERSRMAIGTVMHEVGHSMGFWHVSERPHLLSVPYACGRIATEAERHHALVAYRRPVGNMDPDTDPNTAFAMTTATAPRVVECAAR